MPHLTIGLKKIAYSIRSSPRAKRLRLTVRPDGVEVVVPPRVPAREISLFIDSHRGWIGDKVEKYQSLMAAHPGPQRLEDGTSIPFRGEPTPLVVTVTDRVHLHDLHATILHLMGLDHELLTYFHQGRKESLTDVGGKVIEGVLA